MVTGQRENPLLIFFYKDINPTHETFTLITKLTPIAQPPNTITLGINGSTYKSGEDIST